MLGALVDQFLVVLPQAGAALLVRLLALVDRPQQLVEATFLGAAVGAVLAATPALGVALEALPLDTLAAGLGARRLEPQALQFQGADETFPICTRTSCLEPALLRVLLMFQMQPFTPDLAAVVRFTSTTTGHRLPLAALALAAAQSFPRDLLT